VQSSLTFWYSTVASFAWRSSESWTRHVGDRKLEITSFQSQLGNFEFTSSKERRIAALITAFHLPPALQPLIPSWLACSFFRRPLRLTSNGSPYTTGPLPCRTCLSVTLVYCGQTVGWIKNATWHTGTPRPRRYCVTRGPASHRERKGA